MRRPRFDQTKMRNKSNSVRCRIKKKNLYAGTYTYMYMNNLHSISMQMRFGLINNIRSRRTWIIIFIGSYYVTNKFNPSRYNINQILPQSVNCMLAIRSKFFYYNTVIVASKIRLSSLRGLNVIHSVEILNRLIKIKK